MYYLAVTPCRGNLQHVQVPQLTNQHPFVTVLGCQSSLCVINSMCNILGNQLVILKIEQTCIRGSISQFKKYTAISEQNRPFL